MNKKHTMKKRSDKINWSKMKSLTEKEIFSATKSDPDAKFLTRAQFKKIKHVSLIEKINVKHSHEASCFTGRICGIFWRKIKGYTGVRAA